MLLLGLITPGPLESCGVDGVTHFDMGSHTSVPFLLLMVANMFCEALGCIEEANVVEDMGMPII